MPGKSLLDQGTVNGGIKRLGGKGRNRKRVVFIGFEQVHGVASLFLINTVHFVQRMC